MKYLALFLIKVILISGMISNMNSVETTFSSLDTFYTPMGHELDCEDMCKICVDENTFNGVYKAYEKTVGSKSKVKVEDLDKKLVKKAKEMASSRKGLRRRSDTGEDLVEEDLTNGLKDDENTLKKAACTEGQTPEADGCTSVSKLVDNEMNNEQDALNAEVDMAVKKVTDGEGLDTDKDLKKIEDVSNRVRSKMEKKYRKAAARKLGVSYSAYESEKKRLSSRKIKTGTNTKGTDLAKLKKQYFDVCVKSEAKFYAYAAIKE
tara:strand:+ start:80 stop:868 length:789 start_codon:yes stop_codon:yes gene_type:complete